MKILDRYVLWGFLKNYLISFMVLVGLYVVLDMVVNIDEFSEVKTAAGVTAPDSALSVVYNLADYYFYQTFLFFSHLSGIIPLVAAVFTLMRLTRTNELTPMLAAGVPLLRVAAPIIIAAAVLNLILLPIDQELIIPGIIPQLIRNRQQAGQRVIKAFPIPSMQDGPDHLLVAARYRASDPPTMEYVTVFSFDEQRRPLSKLTADLATWNGPDQSWTLTNGQLVTGLRENETISQPVPTDSYRGTVTPDEISLYRNGDYVALLSTQRINQLISRPESYGIIDLLRVKHTRFTQVFLNIVLVLLAIPFVLNREPGALKAGLFRCFILSGVCLTVVFVSTFLAGNPPQLGDSPWFARWPALMAWLPLLLFGPLAVWLLDHVKT